MCEQWNHPRSVVEGIAFSANGLESFIEEGGFELDIENDCILINK